MKRKSSNKSDGGVGNGNSNSLKVLVIIGVLFLGLIFSFYFIVTSLFLATFPPSSEETFVSSRNDIHQRAFPQVSQGEQQQHDDVTRLEDAHLFHQIPPDSPHTSCLHRDSLMVSSEVLEENEPHNLHIFSSPSQRRSSSYQICLGYHVHQHTIRIDLLEGTCDIYFSTTHLPTPTHWDWKLNHRLAQKISIHSYSPEFRTLNDGSLYLTVAFSESVDHLHHSGGSSAPHCEISVQILEYSNEKLLHLLPALRGGKVLLHRDVENLTHHS
jgi:hypothetical protein